MLFWIIGEVFFVLLSFIGSLATKCMSLNSKCMTRFTLIDLNPVDRNY